MAAGGNGCFVVNGSTELKAIARGGLEVGDDGGGAHIQVDRGTEEMVGSEFRFRLRLLRLVVRDNGRLDDGHCCCTDDHGNGGRCGGNCYGDGDGCDRDPCKGGHYNEDRCNGEHCNLSRRIGDDSNEDRCKGVHCNNGGHLMVVVVVLHCLLVAGGEEQCFVRVIVAGSSCCRIPPYSFAGPPYGH